MTHFKPNCSSQFTSTSINIYRSFLNVSLDLIYRVQGMLGYGRSRPTYNSALGHHHSLYAAHDIVQLHHVSLQHKTSLQQGIVKC